MPITDTPLRYPGGKSQMTPLVMKFLAANDLFYGEYAEPFAGGSGIAMSLLLNDVVSRVYLNDIDPAIHAFWKAVLRHGDDLCELIDRVSITLAERERQREVFLSGTGTSLEMGFATLVLNRTNRSGILRGGVIGGKEQNGNYKLDCRFNKADLIRKVQRIAGYADQISLTKLDAKVFLRQVIKKAHPKTLVNLDPPYFSKGPELYTSFYRLEDHKELAQEVGKLKHRWIVTYDDTPEIRQIYAKYPIYRTSLNYFAQDKRKGAELLILDPKLVLPEGIRRRRLCATA